ncbi:MAG TPA: radical SAM protein [Atribacteraceae bacterium]|nr:radical SAM protein [Atribacteraceae bacterium]
MKNLTFDEKVEVLGKAAQYDLCGACFAQEPRRRKPGGGWIYPAVFPNGKKANLLKILLSNHCSHNCYYCSNREGRLGVRSRFTAEELVRLFLLLHQQKRVRGLFLSSALDRNPYRTMEEMLKTADLLRRQHRFGGYIHLKILPESPSDYIEEALRLATRVSVNIEAPTPEHLRSIAPQKDFARIWSQFVLLREYARKGLKAAAGFTTQLVVGGSKENDRQIIETIAGLYREYGMARAYYSAFQPVDRTPLAEKQGESTWREHRLYQADFLLRKYGFQPEELIFDQGGNLFLKTDPKKVWAINHPEFFPVEINRATYQELLRVPGIGPVSAKKILTTQRLAPFREAESLRKLGVRTGVAASYLLINGKRASGQLSLFEKRRAPATSDESFVV